MMLLDRFGLLQYQASGTETRIRKPDRIPFHKYDSA